MLSLEAREDLARRVIENHARRLRAELGALEQPVLREVAWDFMAAESAKLRATDPARATIFAEAYLLGALREPRSAYQISLSKHPVLLERETRSTRVEALGSVMATEPVAARRQALVEGLTRCFGDTRGAARSVVDAMRAAQESLGIDLFEATGVGGDGYDVLLQGTQEVFRELDAWVLKALEIDRTRLTWAGRTRATACREITRQSPPATWSQSASGWIARVGMHKHLAAMASELNASRREGDRVLSLRVQPGERVTVAGAPGESGHWAMELSGVLCESLGAVGSLAESPGEALGVDRAVGSVLHALGRRLWLSPSFVTREAGVDRGARQKVMLEALHAEALRTRDDAAKARLMKLAMARVPGLTQRFTEDTTRALGVAPPTVFAVHWAARGLDDDTRWNARALGARVEPYLMGELRERFDEDWFRNPRAGLGLSAAIDEMRRVGVKGWCAARKIDPDAQGTGARMAYAMAEARRG